MMGLCHGLLRTQVQQLREAGTSAGAAAAAASPLEAQAAVEAAKAERSAYAAMARQASGRANATARKVRARGMSCRISLCASRHISAATAAPCRPQLEAERVRADQLLAQVGRLLESRDKATTDTTASAASTIATCLQAIKGEANNDAAVYSAETRASHPARMRASRQAITNVSWNDACAVCETRVKAMATELARLKAEEASNEVTLTACQSTIAGLVSHSRLLSEALAAAGVPPPPPPPDVLEAAERYVRELESAGSGEEGSAGDGDGATVASASSTVSGSRRALGLEAGGASAGGGGPRRSTAGSVATTAAPPRPDVVAPDAVAPPMARGGAAAEVVEDHDGLVLRSSNARVNVAGAGASAGAGDGDGEDFGDDDDEELEASMAGRR